MALETLVSSQQRLNLLKVLCLLDSILAHTLYNP